MSQDAFPLTVEILENFRAALQTAGAPLGTAIGPGLTDDEIARYSSELGVTIPPELRTLWEWGCPSKEASTTEAGWDFNPAFEFWSPEIVVRMTDSYRDSDADLTNYIAFAGPPQDGCLVIAGDEGASTSEVREWYIDYPAPVDSGPSLAPSLGVLFFLWTKQLTEAYTFSGGLWHPEDPLPLPKVW